MKKVYSVDLRLVRKEGSLYEAVALIEDDAGNEIDIITFYSEYMSKSGVVHSTLVKAAQKVVEHGGKYIMVRCNFVPLWKDLTTPRVTFPLTKVTFKRLSELGIKITEVELFRDEETGLVL